jgi:hypothetical protein
LVQVPDALAEQLPVAIIVRTRCAHTSWQGKRRPDEQSEKHQFENRLHFLHLHFSVSSIVFVADGSLR